jgi:hypothetical protein
MIKQDTKSSAALYYSDAHGCAATTPQMWHEIYNTLYIRTL